MPASLEQPGAVILLAHAPAERKEKLYKKTLPQQDLGFFGCYLFPSLISLHSWHVCRKGKNTGKKKKIRLAAGRKTYSRNYFLLVSLCLGFHNPELHVLQRRCL